MECILNINPMLHYVPHGWKGPLPPQKVLWKPAIGNGPRNSQWSLFTGTSYINILGCSFARFTCRLTVSDKFFPQKTNFWKLMTFRIIHNRIPVAALVGARSSWKKCFGLLWKWLEVSSQGPCDTHTALESNSSFAQQPLPTSNKCNSKYFVKQLCIEEKVNV